MENKPKIVYITEMPFYTKKLERSMPDSSVLFVQMAGLEAAHYPIDIISSNPHVLDNYDVAIFIYPKSNPDALDLCKEIKKHCKLVLNQEGPRDFWYNWSPEHQLKFIEAMDLCDMFFANNDSDLQFFRGFIGDKVVLSPVSFNPEAVEKFTSVSKNDWILIGGNMCSWYGGLSSLKVTDGINLKINFPSMGRRQVNEEILSKNYNRTYNDFMTFDQWIYFVSNHKYAVHLMGNIGGGNLSLLCSALGIPIIGNKLWDTQRICQPDLSIDIWEIEKGRELLKRLIEDKEFYDMCSRKAKENAYKYFTIDTVADIQLKNLEKITNV